MIDKTGAFKARIVNILKENEFSETINHIKDDFIDSIASDIAKSIIVKKATDDELRLEVKRYFEEYFDNKYLDEASIGINNQLAEELGQMEYDFYYSQAEIYDDKENNDDRYMVFNNEKMEFNENININVKKSKT